jgi:hypothetical protein
MAPDRMPHFLVARASVQEELEGDVLLGGACEEQLLQLIDAVSFDFAGREVRQVAARYYIRSSMPRYSGKTKQRGLVADVVRTEPAVGQEFFVLEDATNYHPSRAHLQGMFSA